MPTPDPIETAKRRSTAQLLFRAARLWNDAAIARLNARGIPVKQAHTRLFPHLDFEGRRVVELAADAGISKQAVSRTLQELEAMGVVERVADPTDGRAQQVRYSSRGGEAILHGLAELGAMEEQLAARVGRDRMDQLRTTLAVLVDVLEPE